MQVVEEQQQRLSAADGNQQARDRIGQLIACGRGVIGRLKSSQG